MEKVFISYSHKDEEWVKNWLLPRLEKAGLRTHIDFRDFEIGKPGIVNMEKAVKECEKTLLVLTPNWLESEWTIFESLMLQLKDPAGLKGCVLPLLLEKCQLPSRLSIFTYADFTDETNWKTELSRLLEQMGIIYFPGKTTEKGYAKPKEDDICLFKLPTTGRQLFGRKKGLELLNKAWADEHTHIVTLKAWGGVGKTALVNHWLNFMERENYGGAQKVFGWSFYSQGAEEGKQASADEFFQETLTWFGDRDLQAGSAVNKGRRLARLVRQQKTLLILDGMEPLQYPPGELHGFDGKLKDQGMQAFLKELANKHNGLCIITTREQVTDLEHKTGFAVKEISLENLSEDAGVQLLKSLGVTTGLDKDFKEAVTEYGGHALALSLLGRYVTSVLDADIRKRDEIPKLTGERIQGRHARRVMEAYEHWLGESPEEDILYIMGLFDRPVEKGVIDALKESPSIPGVTEKLQHLSKEDWQWALTNLRNAHLLAAENPEKPDNLDCHPLVREHFGEKLRQQNPESWKEAHKRLYNYFKNLPEKEYPDTLQEMEPLFAAVAHGCQARLHQEALDDVYFERISRKKEYFCMRKLGAFGVELATISYFFDFPWKQPAAGLLEDAKTFILTQAGSCLRAMGRLQEAIQPMKAGLDNFIKHKNWFLSAKVANNLSHLMLTLGEIQQAVTYARQSISHADRSKDKSWKDVSRTSLANALHQFGEVTEAENWFLEAEETQKISQPWNPFLYSLQGFEFCDLLLGKGKYKEVMKRAEMATEVAKQSGFGLLAFALDQLSLGRAWMMQAQKEKGGDFSRAMAFLDQAMVELRKAGAQDHLPRALFARAECYRWMKNHEKAWEDLNEAKEIAKMGSMKLFLCDYHLEAGRLCRAEGKKDEAEEHLKMAEDLTEETGYYRRREEPRKIRREE